MSTKTIAAIATSVSNSGISIIRISGKESLSIIKKIFKTTHNLEPNRIVFGKIIKNNTVLDSVLVSYFKAPYSFTGEDICEINCHGGREITREILELVLENGAYLAEGGEFSKRAFLNGKMDLSQAEGIIQLINAKTSLEASIASKQLEGELSKKIRVLREELIELLAHIEVSIDYPEYDYEEVENTAVLKQLEKQISIIHRWIDSYEQGKYIKNGINVAILGKPNVGKSSLLNALAKYEKAIVTDIPGTTRDIVEETINIGELVLNISDTAGIRDTDDKIEKIGVKKSIEKLDEVDLVIYILNAEEKISEEDKKLLSKIQNKGLKNIVMINKMDKVEKTIFDTILDELKALSIETAICASVRKGEGIEELKNSIYELFYHEDFDFEDGMIITNARHKDLLKKAVVSLEKVKEEIGYDTPIDILSIGLKNAARQLGEIIGCDVSQDIVNKIFEKFCLGK